MEEKQLLNLKNKNIVITSSHLWNWCFRAGIHYFTDFFCKKGANVTFITLPFSFLTLGSKLGIKTKFLPLFKLWLQRGRLYKYFSGRINWITLFSIFHPSSRIPFFKSNNWIAQNFLRLSLPSPKKCFKNISKEKSIRIFMFDGQGIHLFNYLKPEISIYRIFDDLEDLGYPKNILSIEKKVIKEVDIILAVSRSIYEKINKVRKQNVYYLPNGVDLTGFKKNPVFPKEYPNISKPRIVYLGSGYLVDWRLLINLANKMKSYSFVVIGPCPSKVVKMSLPKNIHMLGVKSPDEVPSYLFYSDVGIMPFKKIPAIFNMERPLKFYQYLAAGLPIVSIDYGRLKMMAPYASFAQDENKFVEELNKALNTSLKYREGLRNASKEFSWEKTYSQFETILTKYSNSNNK